MFVDASTFPAGHVERARVCIFGSGPAGMTLAHSLAEDGIDVLLVEAGGLEFEDESQELYQGTVIGDEYYDLEYARLRYFGGTSGHWAGYCRPLDAHDFEENPGVPHTGWPIGRDALDPYLKGAAEVLEISDEFPDRELSPNLDRTTFNLSPPVRFGDKYLDEAETRANLRVVLNTAVTNMTPDAGRVRSATVQTMGGESWTIEAEYFVLCAGGIENSRLLLWFNEQNDRQLIANHDIIGRYWMEHPTVSTAEVAVDGAREDIFDDGQAYFALSGALEKTHGVLNASFDIDIQAYKGKKALVADLLCIAPKLGQWVMGTEKTLVCGSRVHVQWEQAPDPENRVALGEEKDALGIPRPVLHWRKTTQDRRTATASTLALAEEFAALDFGRVRLFDWIDDESLPIPVDNVMASWHHMGGTRMSASPETGVVDADLRVHDLDNLYVGGSSVFPTSGYANPTLTIVQLSLRLADHLRTRLAV
jgi:choline dehydrogenase-like flavoprotein